MLEISNIKIYDLKESVVACRNAMRLNLPEYTDDEFEKALPRAISLAKCGGGSGHSNFRKGIRVSFDIKYPNYISPELQRYGFVDIVSSSSKMHRLINMDLNMCCNKYVSQKAIDEMTDHIGWYNYVKDTNRDDFEYRCILRDGTWLKTKDKKEALYWTFMKCISNCPQGIELFMRCSTNYEQLATIYKQRKNHKLKEDWGAFCTFIENLPYSKELILVGLNIDSDEQKKDN